jgi:hypothetical protein
MLPPSASWAYEFVKNNPQLRSLKPTLLDVLRIKATLKSNVEPFLNMVRGFIQSGRFDPYLTFQMDETSCLVKSIHLPKRVVSSTTFSIPMKKVPPILHLTTLFIVKAAGEHLPPQLLFPEDLDCSSVPRWKFKDLEIWKTRKGWMEREIFEVIMKQTIEKEVKRVREKSSDMKKEALLILDGHTSRNNRRFWEHFHDLGITVLVLPAHTSHLLQPLDLGPNAAFKKALEKADPFPKKREIRETLESFIRSLCDCFYAAMEPHIVRSSFERAGFTSETTTHVLSKCLETLPESITEKPQTKRFSINGQCITSDEFLSKWKDFERNRERKKKKKETALTEEPLETGETTDSLSDTTDVEVEEGEDRILTLSVEGEAEDIRGDEEESEKRQKEIQEKETESECKDRMEAKLSSSREKSGIVKEYSPLILQKTKKDFDQIVRKIQVLFQSHAGFEDEFPLVKEKQRERRTGRMKTKPHSPPPQEEEISPQTTRKEGIEHLSLGLPLVDFIEFPAPVSIEMGKRSHPCEKSSRQEEEIGKSKKEDEKQRDEMCKIDKPLQRYSVRSRIPSQRYPAEEFISLESGVSMKTGLVSRKRLKCEETFKETEE